MATESATTTTSTSAGGGRSAGAVARALWQLSRPRIVAMVALMVVAALAAASRPLEALPLFHALFGSIAVVVGALALNQRIEHRTDGMMPRTAARPLPAGRLSEREATWFALAVTAGGLVYLATLVNLSTTILAALSWLIYVWIYTPLKVFTAWQTPIGAIPGAMPALLGSAAAEATFSVNGLALFAIVYFWQFPHAMAIAWLYREQFGRAGTKVASVTDPSGRTAATITAVGALILLPASLLPTVNEDIGWPYGVAATALGSLYLAASFGFLRRLDDRAARKLLRTSLVYLPLIFVALLVAALT